MQTVLPENRARTLALIRSKMDHDLRSNLNVILGYCSMLTEDLESVRDPTELAGDLGYIAAAGQELLHLNRQVGDLLEVQQGKWKLAVGEVTVDYVAQDVIDAISERFPSHRFELDGSARLIDADARTLNRLLGWVVTQLCKSTAVPTVIDINIEPLTDGAAIDITCSLDHADDAERRKVQRALTTFLVPVPALNNIQDFEGYYRSVMCEMASADIDANPESLSCRVVVSGTVDCAEDRNSEASAG